MLKIFKTDHYPSNPSNQWNAHKYLFWQSKMGKPLIHRAF
ncbi:hypothetical protein NSPZN2_10025 [Nitrospira defluvii]|uniref:Uncharacterized protein n=1 Tax=Nitrospira defluvii TaxID=330214 RepID=A0ABM8QAW7_9BACT|nr:hypothetical protein NSPZN2_10025 [Nitrospira defluvii]